MAAYKDWEIEKNERIVGEHKDFLIIRMQHSGCFLIKGYYGAYISKEICERVIDTYLEHIEEQEKINQR